jgi:hypothetical protein
MSFPLISAYFCDHLNITGKLSIPTFREIPGKFGWCGIIRRPVRNRIRISAALAKSSSDKELPAMPWKISHHQNPGSNNCITASSAGQPKACGCIGIGLTKTIAKLVDGIAKDQLEM